MIPLHHVVPAIVSRVRREPVHKRLARFRDAGNAHHDRKVQEGIDGLLATFDHVNRRTEREVTAINRVLANAHSRMSALRTHGLLV